MGIVLVDICSEDKFFHKEISDFDKNFSKNFYLFVLVIRRKSKYSSVKYKVTIMFSASVTIYFHFNCYWSIAYRQYLHFFPLFESCYLLGIELLHHYIMSMKPLQTYIISAIKVLSSSKKRADEITVYKFIRVPVNH